MRHDVIQTVFQMHALVRRQLLDGADAGPPFPGRPDRPRHEAAAAVRAYVVQLGLDAVRAEGAFVSADPRLHRIRRQVLVAIFAVRSELQRHGRLIVLNPDGSLQIEVRKRMTDFPRFGPYRSSSFSDVQLHIVDAPLGAGPESILTIAVMDSGLALRAPRNDGACTLPRRRL